MLRSVLWIVCLFAALSIRATAVNQVQLDLKTPHMDTYTSQLVTCVALTLNEQALDTDVPAFLSGGRTMVPVRVISEALGAQVQWNQDAKEITITSQHTTIVLIIDSATAMVDGQAVDLFDGVPATLVRQAGVHRTMVPLRFVSEQLGAEVGWDPATYTAEITPPAASEPPAQPEPPASQMTAPVYAFRRADHLCGGRRAACHFFSARPGCHRLSRRGLFGQSAGSISVSGSAVHTVRFNQYDAEYPGYSRVARIVLDLRPGYGLADLAIAFDEGVLSAAFPVAAEQQTQPPATEPAPARIVLDAGHGGTEKGAMAGDLPEKVINLSVTNQVGALLSAMGYEVLYTRLDDETVSLQDRAAFANDHNADLFVCIHSNSFPSNPEISGVETYYLPSQSNPNSPGKLPGQPYSDQRRGGHRRGGPLHPAGQLLCAEAHRHACGFGGDGLHDQRAGAGAAIGQRLPGPAGRRHCRRHCKIPAGRAIALRKSRFAGIASEKGGDFSRKSKEKFHVSLDFCSS